jgi:lysozyme
VRPEETHRHQTPAKRRGFAFLAHRGGDMPALALNVSDLLKLHEGFSASPYRCTAGKTTIGHGRNLEDRGITREEADYLLSNDIMEAVKHLRDEPYWLDLGEVRQSVLIDMVVNMGWTRFCGFRRMREALAAGDYHLASVEMTDSAWYAQVGQRSARLCRMMDSGEWPVR